MAKPILGYWELRGRALPIRCLLHYKNVDFEDKLYYIETFDAWFKEKFTLGLDFPNLPYYIDGSVKLSQSVAILRYLARKYGLDGETDQQRLRVEFSEQQIAHLRTNLRNLCYNAEFEKLKPEFVKNLQTELKLFDAFLGDRKFIAGDDVTYVDFMAYDLFDCYCFLVHKVLDNFPRLKTYYDGIKNLPELQKYFNSPTYKRWPLFGPIAYFGGKGPEPNFE